MTSLNSSVPNSIASTSPANPATLTLQRHPSLFSRHRSNTVIAPIRPNPPDPFHPGTRTTTASPGRCQLRISTPRSRRTRTTTTITSHLRTTTTHRRPSQQRPPFCRLTTPSTKHHRVWPWTRLTLALTRLSISTAPRARHLIPVSSVPRMAHSRYGR